MTRFDRQTILPEFGSEGQQKLANAKVLVVGAGGLGSPSLLYLAAAGVGYIGIADGDSVSESNLNRQTLFGYNDIGKPKAETAAFLLKTKYPDITFKVFPHFLTAENTLDILENFDLILDGSDNFATRYMINDACVLLNKPLVMGAIYQFEGQVAVFNYGDNPINYRDLYPTPPAENEIPNCSETGVIGVLPGIIGTLQAAEAIKILSGLGKVLTNKILFFSFKTSEFFYIDVQPNPTSNENIPQSRELFRKKGYEINCGTAESISWEKALDWSGSLENALLIDIREPGEKPQFHHAEIKNFPMSFLAENQEDIKQTEHLFLFCKTGQRSSTLAKRLKNLFPEKKIYSIEGGILDTSSPLNSSQNGT